MVPTTTRVAKIESIAVMCNGFDDEVTGKIIVDLRGVLSISLKAGQRASCLVYDSLAISDIKIILREARSPSRQATDAFFVLEEPLLVLHSQ